MRTALWGIVMAGTTLAGWLSLGAGCGSLPAECSERFTCPTGGGGSSGGPSTSTGGGGGGDGGPPPGCEPSVEKDAVADTCGIFVSSSLGDDAASDVGTKKVPYKTLAAAVAAAGKKKTRVYACAETFTEPVTVAASTGIYGGLDCTKDWIYAGGAKSTLTAAADAVPLTLSKTASSVELSDFEVQAADAVADGGSSIAVIADAVTASFTRCDLIAGNGVKGADGMLLGESPGPNKSTDPLIAGNNGADACSDPVKVSGGLPKENTLCLLASNPIGGVGGDGFLNFGTNGGAAPANTQTALGGNGQITNGWGCNAGAGQADNGANGEGGMDGAGATGDTSLGQLTLAGYVGVSGLSGDDGKPGQGGGGGGGARGKAGCLGASGGGGGTGGCGGLGGTGGKAGGASIALVSLGATLSFTTVSITLGIGGTGGDGGEGHSGKTGGNGGVGGVGSGTAVSACDGGKGGQGGVGGQGGGGRGGHVIGIAASGGTTPALEGVTFTQQGTPGLGGKGGMMQDGDPGVKADVQMFP